MIVCRPFTSTKTYHGKIKLLRLCDIVSYNAINSEQESEGGMLKHAELSKKKGFNVRQLFKQI